MRGQDQSGHPVASREGTKVTITLYTTSGGTTDLQGFYLAPSGGVTPTVGAIDAQGRLPGVVSIFGIPVQCAYFVAE
jgi:hypothetical protein